MPNQSFHIGKCQSEHHVYLNLLSDGLSGRVAVSTTIWPSFHVMSSKGTWMNEMSVKNSPLNTYETWKKKPKQKCKKDSLNYLIFEIFLDI